MTASLSSFLMEVSEQPKALKDLVAFYRAQGRPLLDRWARLARAAGRVVFSGMGTSEFAPESVAGKLAGSGIDASTIDAGEWLHYPRSIDALTVLVSQSGESAEIRGLASRFGGSRNLVAVTNDTESTLAKSADLVLPLEAGRETAISTKTYVNTLALLFLMAESLENRCPLDRLESLADTMGQYDPAGIEGAAQLLADAQAIHCVARGPALAAAKQAALTFMEGTRTPAAAFAGGAFRHGPFELVDSAHRCVFFLPEGATAELLKGMIGEVVRKQSRIVVVTDADFHLEESNACVLYLPRHGEDLFCLSAATTQELLLDAVASRKGVTAGIFRHGQKITSRE